MATVRLGSSGRATSAGGDGGYAKNGIASEAFQFAAERRLAE